VERWKGILKRGKKIEYERFENVTREEGENKKKRTRALKAKSTYIILWN
jgi:hypothetical protein